MDEQIHRALVDSLSRQPDVRCYVVCGACLQRVAPCGAANLTPNPPTLQSTLPPLPTGAAALLALLPQQKDALKYSVQSLRARLPRQYAFSEHRYCRRPPSCCGCACAGLRVTDTACPAHRVCLPRSTPGNGPGNGQRMGNRSHIGRHHPSIALGCRSCSPQKAHAAGRRRSKRQPRRWGA